MRIAIVLERIEAWRGGAETSTQQFTRALAEAGHDVHLICRTPQTAVEDLTIHPIDPYAAMNQQRTLTFARRAASYTAKRDFDIIHAVTPCMTADIYQPRGGFVVESIRRNLAVRQTWPARLFKRITNQFNRKRHGMLRLERQLLSRSPRPPYVAAVSEYVARQAREHFNLSRDRARVIFNGIRLEDTSAADREDHRVRIRERYKLTGNELVALFVAHNFKLKGLKYLVLAVKRLADQDLALRVLIVGQGNTLGYRRLAESLGISDRIIFAGPTGNARQFLHAADMLVHPTFYDPCSRVVLEAIAAGLPTVTTRYNGAVEILTDNVTGYIIDEPTDVPALADAIRKLADPDHRAAVAQKGLELRDRFDIAAHTQQMIQLYEDVWREKEHEGGT